MDLYTTEVNLATGEVTRTPFTAEEIAAYEASLAEQAQTTETLVEPAA